MAGAAALAWFRLDISTDQDQLFSGNVPFFRDYLGFTKAFPENQAGYVVVQARDPDHPPATERWTGVADAIAARLAADPADVRSVEAHVPFAQLGRQGLLFTDDPAEVPRRAKQAATDLVPLAKLWGERPGFQLGLLGPTPIHRVLSALRLAPDDQVNAQLAQFLDLLARSWVDVLADPTRPVRPGGPVPDLAALEASGPRERGYSYIPDPDNPAHHLLLVKVFEQNKLNSLNGLVRVIAGIRADVAAAAQPFDAEFTVGLSGRPALDADELSTTDRDSRRAEVVSLTAVFLGLAVFLRSVWLAVVAEVALLIGIAWTFGWATVSTAAYNRTTRGDLNLLSSVFLIALIGIGMDYLIQVLTRYRQEAVRHGADTRRDARSIWAGVFKHVAAPINTACLGAAGAFLVSVFTPFRGAAELGLIAGGGLLLCLASGYVVLPALLTIRPARVRPTAAERAGADPLAPPPPAHRNWRLVLPAAFAALLLAGAPFMRRTRFDPGLLSLQTQGLESVQLVHKLPTWFDVELSTDLTVLRQAGQAVERLAERPSDHTESVLSAWDNYQYLRANPLPDVHWAARRRSPAGTWRHRRPGRRAGRPVRDDGRGAPQAVHAAAASSLRLFASCARGAAAGRRRPGRPGRPTAHALAGCVRRRAEGPARPVLPRPAGRAGPAGHAPRPPARDRRPVRPVRLPQGRLLAAGRTWPRSSPASRGPISDLNRQGGSVPPITGVASDVFHSTDQTHAAFRDATLYALGLIFLLVLLDLRDLRQTLLAISVLALGLPMLVAVMGLLGINWNFANFFGLPILIGAGHEYGVFMVHRYNEACRDAHRPWRRWDVSDRALLLCGYVTSISFGFFWLFGHHLGLRSLGLVMALGIACIYLSTLCVLRPLLLWKLARGTGRAPARAVTPTPEPVTAA